MNGYKFSGMTGGTETDLDNLSVSTLTTGDVALVFVGGVYYFYEYDSTATAAESSPDVIRPDDYSTGGNWELMSPARETFYEAYVKASEVQSSGTAGGTFTAGDWRTRVINTEDDDEESIASIATNQITLPAGTYRCLISCPGFRCSLHQARLYDITGSAVLLTGTSEYSYSDSWAAVTRSMITGRFTLSESSALEIQHRCSSSRSTDGLGRAGSFGDEVYTVAEFWRET